MTFYPSVHCSFLLSDVGNARDVSSYRYNATLVICSWRLSESSVPVVGCFRTFNSEAPVLSMQTLKQKHFFLEPEPDFFMTLVSGRCGSAVGSVPSFASPVFGVAHFLIVDWCVQVQ